MNYKDYIPFPLTSLHNHNYYGSFSDNMEGWKSTGICHAQFKYGQKNPHVWTNAANNKNKETNRYFEYILDKEKSPYRDLLKVMEHKVVRNDSGLITGVICYNVENISTAVLMCFLKSMRQVLESKSYHYFNFICDNTNDDKKITEAWYLMHFLHVVSSNRVKSVFHVGEHTAIKNKWNDRLYKKEIKNIFPEDDNLTIKKSLSRYTAFDLSFVTFDTPRLDWEFNGFNRERSLYLKNKTSKKKDNQENNTSYLNFSNNIYTSNGYDPDRDIFELETIFENQEEILTWFS